MGKGARRRPTDGGVRGPRRCDPSARQGSGTGVPESGAGAPATLPQATAAIEQPLVRLAARAREAGDVQGPLLGLLRANLEMSGGMDLDEVLRRTMDAARDLAHARYSAICLARDGQVVRFLYDGPDAEGAALAGHAAEYEGPPRPLADRPQRLRLGDLSHLPFADRRQPMCSLLCVPVRANEWLCGNLYLTGKQGGGDFTAEDEDLVAALMAEAGVAIGNAIMFAEACQRQEWQAALIEITAQLLAGADPEQVLRRMVRRAACASTADGAIVTVPTEDPGRLRVAVAEGEFRRWQGETFPVDGSASAIAIAERRPVLLADLSNDPRVRIAGHPLREVGAAVVAPIAGDAGVTGALIVAKSRGRGSFDAADVDMIVGFAGQAALALELAEARRDAERLRLLEDRQRIGEDLQHRVIHRLFGLGLSIQAIAARVGDTSVKNMITDRVEEIDEIIRDIRATVFALRTSDGGD